MKRTISNILTGKDSTSAGLIALAFVLFVALGCACGEGLDLGNLGSDNSSGRPASNAPSNTTTAAETDDGTLPSDERIRSLVSETTSDFADAVDNNDFSEIYEKSSKDFKLSYTLEQTQQAFKPFVDQKRRVVPLLRKAEGMEVEFTSPPSIREEQGLSILVVDGRYDTTPLPVAIEYEYVFRDGEWRMLKLVTNIK